MIYFIAEVGDESGPVKIGHSKLEMGEDGCMEALRHRVRDAQLGNHRQLAAIAVMRGTQRDEAAMHDQFAKQWVRGEWHSRCPELETLLSMHAIAPAYSSSARRVERRGQADDDVLEVRCTLRG